ncbi:DUF7168 domain-containing protein [Paracoccus denitrificans]|uniref:DUF7168 domain-containing protein n=1 Tax=Paracoccus denitrificans TaxID=266 RepID=UPI0033652845
MADLMREHQLTAEDVEYEEAEAPLKTKRATLRTALLGTIAVCTNCTATIRSDWQPCVIFLGKAPGPEIATYLFSVCDRAIDRAIADFKLTPDYRRRRTLTTRRAAVADFTAGMVARLSRRLYGMFSDSMDEEALAAAKRVRDIRMPDLTTANIPERKVRFGNAAAAGYAAGRSVQLAHGVSGGRAPRQIGRV